jgi:hypothetical protein
MFRTWCDLRVYVPGEWVVLRDLIWEKDGVRAVVPRGFITDLASQPRLSRAVLDICGPSREPAVLHDWLYCKQEDADGRPISREFADDLFRTALRVCGAGPITRNTYWSGVRVGGWLYWDKRENDPLNGDDFAPARFLEDVRIYG